MSKPPSQNILSVILWKLLCSYSKRIIRWNILIIGRLPFQYKRNMNISELCFSDTIDWEKIVRWDADNNFISNNKDVNDCPGPLDCPESECAKPPCRTQDGCQQRHVCYSCQLHLPTVSQTVVCLLTFCARHFITAQIDISNLVCSLLLCIKWVGSCKLFIDSKIFNVRVFSTLNLNFQMGLTHFLNLILITGIKQYILTNIF